LAKGDLKAEYGVPWEKMKWYVSKEETVSFKLKDGVFLQKIGKNYFLFRNIIRRKALNATTIDAAPH
jgi:alanyl-tRNA synthetase